MSTSPCVTPLSGDDNTWERRYFKALDVAPYVLLGVSTLLSQLQPSQTAGDHLAMIGLAALAAAWVLVMYTLPPPQWRQHPGAMLAYFAGLLAIGGALEARSIVFLAFVITGFFQAFIVLPTALAFLGVAATSCVLYL